MKKAKSTKRRRDRGISVWVDEPEAQLLEKAAALGSYPVSSWMRKTSLREAKKELGL